MPAAAEEARSPAPRTMATWPPLIGPTAGVTDAIEGTQSPVVEDRGRSPEDYRETFCDLVRRDPDYYVSESGCASIPPDQSTRHEADLPSSPRPGTEGTPS